jgi:AcrR family transcriptional regulator
VFAQVLAGSVDELYRTAREGQPDLAAAVLAYLRAFAAKPRLRRGTLEAALDSTEAARVWLEERRRFHRGLARHLRREQEAGTARPVDADVAAQALGSMVEWYGYTTLVFAESDGDVELERAAAELAKIWHHAVHPD